MPEIPTGLAWGVKTSFVDYISSMYDGYIATYDGAYLLDPAVFHFPLAPAQHDGAVSFVGEVRFTGHFGMLNVSLGNPAIVRHENKLNLTVNDTDCEGGRRNILVLEGVLQTADVVEFTRPVLTLEGAELFFDNYRPGTLFSPIRIPADCATSLIASVHPM